MTARRAPKHTGRFEPAVKMGFGFDAHPFSRERTLVLGGIPVRGAPGLSGHSDADVLTHAVIDALLGAAGLGDIGTHFPEANPRYKDISSIVLLARTRDLLNRRGYRVGHLDCTVMTQRPRLEGLKARIRKRIAGCLNVPADSVNVKAKSPQGVGPAVGDSGMMAWALATLVRMANKRR